MNISKFIVGAIMFCMPTFAFAVDNSTVNSSAYNVVNVGGYGGGTGGSGGTSKQIVQYEGGPGGIQGVTSMGAPYIFNSNPCAIANGGSAVGGPFGASISITHIDKACDKRSNAGALTAMKQSGMALIEMCQQPSVADSFWYTYYLVCPGTKAKNKYVTPDGSKPVTALINPVSGEIMNLRQSPVWKVVIAQKDQERKLQLASQQTQTIPDFCETLSDPKEKMKYAKVCKFQVIEEKVAQVLPR